MQASFLEIYNEELRDLLVGHDGGGDASLAKLSIKKSAGGGTEVAGLTKYDIDTGKLLFVIVIVVALCDRYRCCSL